MHNYIKGVSKATIDFETRSVCDLKKSGSWNYSLHPSTEVLCLAYKLPDSSEVKIWHRGYKQHNLAESPSPLDLFAFISTGGLIEAHNVTFERSIWQHIMVVKHNWPKIPEALWRCSLAKASACSLPMDLAGAAKSLNLDMQKDLVGKKLMLKMTKPRVIRKSEVIDWMCRNNYKGDYDEHKEKMLISGYFWHENLEDILRLIEYCKQDVLTEEEFSNKVPELSKKELAIWTLDQQINTRGVKFDIALAKAALVLAAKEKQLLNNELEELTGISSATLRGKIKTWLNTIEAVNIPNTTAITIKWYLANVKLTNMAKRVLEIVQQVNRTSICKYQAILDRIDPADDRARNLLVYHGATTGRWAGRGIQIHNFPRGDIENMDTVCEDIKTAAPWYEAVRISASIQWLKSLYGVDIIKMLSGTLRGTIIPEKEHDLIVADYAAIEARCLLWMAEAKSALLIFEQGKDIYCDMAKNIYGYPVNKKEHPLERRFGKQAILGLGYGMGFITFLLMCRVYSIKFSVEQCMRIIGNKYTYYIDIVSKYLFYNDIEEGDTQVYQAKLNQAKTSIVKLVQAQEQPAKILHELALMKYTVDIYRKQYPEVKHQWDLQERMAILATQEWLKNKSKRTKVYPAGKIYWYVEDDFLCCELPSGRCLRYREPSIQMVKTYWGAQRFSLRYKSIVPGNKWAYTTTYGGKLVENITQAIARDIMAEAMLAINNTPNNPYNIIMSIHDEIVAEVKYSEGSIADFESILTNSSPWANTCPIAAEVIRISRYRK